MPFVSAGAPGPTGATGPAGAAGPAGPAGGGVQTASFSTGSIAPSGSYSVQLQLGGVGCLVSIIATLTAGTSDRGRVALWDRDPTDPAARRTWMIGLFANETLDAASKMYGPQYPISAQNQFGTPAPIQPANGVDVWIEVMNGGVGAGTFQIDYAWVEDGGSSSPQNNLSPLLLMGG